MISQIASRSGVVYIRLSLIAVCMTCVFMISDTTVSSQGAFVTVAKDDGWVWEGRPLYIARNDTSPMPVATIVDGPDFGTLVNSGQFQNYSPGMGGIYVDSYSYKWCETISPYRCSNTATVTLLINADDSQNYGTSCPKVAEPINVTNGNMWLAQKDYSLPGRGEAIEIDRFYNSKLEAGGLFGYGWTTKYDEYLTFYSGQDRMLKLTMPDGAGVYFARPNSSVGFRSVSSRDVKAGIEQEVDGTYTLTFDEGQVHKFDSTGQLLWQQDRNGNQTTLNYNLLGDLDITDSVGRTLTLDLNANGRTLSITDSTGKIADYIYDSTGSSAGPYIDSIIGPIPNTWQGCVNL